MNLGVMLAGGNGARRAHDFYPTPAECTEALLAREASALHGCGWVWEPACGDGAITRVLERWRFKVWSSDLIDRGCGAGGHDFLQARAAPMDAKAIVTNPPFALAEQFIRHALGALQIEYMALLLKATYWHAASRYALWCDFPPQMLYPLTWRPDFDGRGAPTMDVMWCVWDAARAPIMGTEIMPLPRPKSVDDLASLG